MVPQLEYSDMIFRDADLRADEPSGLRKILRSKINRPRSRDDKIDQPRVRRKHLTCRYCSSGYLTRVSCQGMVEHLLSMTIYIYPFRCRSCGCRFLRQEWGVRYQRVQRN